MRAQDRTSVADGVAIGLVFAATGLYFILVSLDVLPGPGPAHGPAAIVFAAGAAFLCAGLVAIVRAAAGAREPGGELPPDAPRWGDVLSRILVIAMAGSMAAIGTWIAIGSGPRAFSLSAPFVEMRTAGEAVGRTMFGLGAVIVWIYVIALTVGTVRKLFDRRSG